MKRPAFQFYPKDWWKDTALRVCSIGARGLWIDMMAIMHDGEPYGHLTVAGAPLNAAELARMVGESATMTRSLLNQLEKHRVFSRTESGVIYSRRMVRDEQLRQVRGQHGVESQKNPSVPRRKDTIPLEGKDTIRPSPAVAVASATARTTTTTTPSAKKPAEGRRETWLTPLHDAHEAIYGAGSFQPLAGRFARHWRRLVQVHGGEKCAKVWTFSQRDVARRPFHNPEYVAGHFADFDPDALWVDPAE